VVDFKRVFLISINICVLFGKEQSLESFLSYSLQFIELQKSRYKVQAEAEIPTNLRAYIAEFDRGLSDEEYNSPNYSFRLLFSRKLVNRPDRQTK